ncbi:MAG: hypothetical protein LKF98_02815 [Microbacteriaceae bacterium]|jgi:protein-tyrosine phosphatase|nr:hypothetical protein [Microbacteriaceae bacterium]
MSPRPENTFQVLFVCTGNICRSALAAATLRALAEERAPFLRIGSAGTAAVAGAPMHFPEAAALQRIGGDPTLHRAQQLTGPLIDTSDLVLALTERHLETVTEERPDALSRSFTLLEYVAVLEHLAPPVPIRPGATALRSQVQQVSDLRTSLGPGGRDGLDIPDPYGKGSDAHRAVDAQVIAAVNEVARAFGLSG